jgi:hypothetical protein
MKIEVLNLCCQIHELAMTRQLTSQITTKGAGLYDLLGKEVEMRVSGTSVIQYSSFSAKYVNSGTKAADVQFHSMSLPVSFSILASQQSIRTVAPRQKNCSFIQCLNQCHSVF